MALDIPTTSEEVEIRAKTDVRRALPESNPFLKNSVLSALIIGYANRVFDFYLQLKEAIRQNFPDTATGTFLERWAAIFGLTRLAATTSTGSIVATGVVTSNIPIGTTFSNTDGVLFDTTATVAITNNVLAVTSIVRVSQTATVTTTTNHNLASNVAVTIAGAGEAEYNGIQEIQVTGLDTFTYEVTGTPSTPASGVITATNDSAFLPVVSQDFQDSENDVNVNLSLDTPLSIQSPIAGVDTVANVSFEQVSGGTDQETDAALRIRLLQLIQNPVANFNVSAIDKQARLINGVTRVFVEEATPDPGQVTIYFMRDNDPDPIPDSGEVTTVKDSILLIKPANTIDADVIVAAPTAVPTAYTFTALDPNTAAMQTAITANLTQFYAEETEVGVDITLEKYTAAIQNTVDEGGTGVTSFTLSSPTTDITIATGEIGTLGTITYP